MMMRRSASLACVLVQRGKPVGGAWDLARIHHLRVAGLTSKGEKIGAPNPWGVPEESAPERASCAPWSSERVLLPGALRAPSLGCSS
eukprot:2301582-Pyramimonas_sp.AAC.1